MDGAIRPYSWYTVMAHIWGDCGIAYGPNSLWSSGGYGWSHAELVWGLLGAYYLGIAIGDCM